MMQHCEMLHRVVMIFIVSLFFVNFMVIYAHAIHCTPATCRLKESYDFIIVGGGTAGCILANRLSEISHWNVLVVEAGGYPPDGSRIPFLAGSLESQYEYTWEYATTPQDGICQITGGKCLIPEAKVLGGMSTTWRMDYIRGLRKDFEQWEAEGNPRWSWRYVLPYFQKAERFVGLTNTKTTLGRNGPWPITASNTTWLSDYFMASLRELGLKDTDLEEGFGGGFASSLNVVEGGERVSTYDAYLKPALTRNNLDLMTLSMVTKILVANNRAVGVQFVHNNKTHQVFARNEVIVTCGAINSPKLLMLSGIGPAAHLKELNIAVVQDLPVGNICKDHPSVATLFRMNEVPPHTGKEMLAEIQSFIKDKTGILTDPAGHMISAFTNSSQATSDRPDIHVFISRPGNRNFVLIGGYCTRPESQGTLRLSSSDPYDKPLIDPKMLSSQKDVVCMRELVELIFQISRTNAARNLGTTYTPEPYNSACKHDSNLRDCLINQYGRSANQMSGTCRMGPNTDPNAVVDYELRVYDVPRLRVVDMSVMPESPSGSIAPVAMMAEKISDVIKRDYLKWST